jgi:hypothetical protein
MSNWKDVLDKRSAVEAKETEYEVSAAPNST